MTGTIISFKDDNDGDWMELQVRPNVKEAALWLNFSAADDCSCATDDKLLLKLSFDDFIKISAAFNRIAVEFEDEQTAIKASNAETDKQ